MNLPTVVMPKVGAGEDASKALVLAVPIGAIIASFLILALVIWPRVNDIFELRKDNDAFSDRAGNLESKAKILASLDEAALEDQLAAAEQLLPSDKNVFPILRQVETAAALSGVLPTKTEVVVGTINERSGLVPPAVQAPVANVSPNSPSLGVAPSVQLRLSISSDYQSLLQFLSNLYAFSRVVSVDSVNISASQGESVQLGTSLSVDAYWKQLPSNLGSVENPIQKLTPDEENLLKNVQEPNVIKTPEVPEVPFGRQDLFSPF